MHYLSHIKKQYIQILLAYVQRQHLDQFLQKNQVHEAKNMINTILCVTIQIAEV